MYISDKNKPVWVTVLQAAQQLRVSRQRIHQLLKEGALTGTKTSSIWLISVRSLEARQALLREESEWRNGRR
jgi:excisionase family DNA binding protein